MHPNSPSYVDKPIERIYVQHENERENEREKIVQWTRSRQVEKASFTPIVMSMSGGEGKEAAHHHKRIATLIAQKRNESYADVIRTRLRFSLLKSTLMASRGVRGKSRMAASISTVSFNLIEQ